MDYSYDNNIKSIVTFSSGKEMVQTTNNIKFYGCNPLIKDSALDKLKSPLEACVVARRQNRELITHLTFHSIEYAHEHLVDNGQF